jgi:hypothetical protein
MIPKRWGIKSSKKITEHLKAVNQTLKHSLNIALLLVDFKDDL